MVEKKDWTVMMYIAEEDRNLLSSFFYGIQEASKYMIYSNINVCILHRSPELYGAFLVNLKGNGKECVVQMNRLKDNIDFHSSEVLSQFVSECKQNFPAERYLFLINCHSNGWYMKQSSVDNRIKSYPSLFEKVFEQKQTFDFILFNSCFCSTIELAYEFRNTTQYIIGCESVGPIYPMWNQTLFYTLSRSKRDSLSDEYIGKSICNEFIYSMNRMKSILVDKKLNVASDISLLDLRYIQPFIESIDVSGATAQMLQRARIKPDRELKEGNVYYVVFDIAEVLKSLTFKEEQKDLFFKLVVVYLQTDTLKEKKWSNRLHGLGYCPCPYMNKENGYTYKHLEIYRYAERFLSKECGLL
jgi:hypothetical protein